MTVIRLLLVGLFILFWIGGVISAVAVFLKWNSERQDSPDGARYKYSAFDHVWHFFACVIGIGVISAIIYLTL